VAPPIGAQFRQEIASLDQVDDVPVLVATVTGPEQLVVMATADVDDTATVADIERAPDEAQRRLVARPAGVKYVLPDPTRPAAGRRRPGAGRGTTSPAERGGRVTGMPDGTAKLGRACA
jgi:hypothetical protein